METKNHKLRSDRDQIYAAADKYANTTNANLAADLDGGLTLPEDRLMADYHSDDWDRQQDMWGTAEADDAPPY